MPSIPAPVAHAVGDLVKRGTEELAVLEDAALELVKRVKIPINSTTPPHLIDAIKQDPWKDADKYALGWVYFCIILLVGSSSLRLWNYWGDRIRIALYKEDVITSALSASSASANPASWDAPTAATDASKQVFFPPSGPLLIRAEKQQSTASAIAPFNNMVAFFRYIFYRPMPQIKIGSWKSTLPSAAVLVIITLGLAFSLLYCFLPQPLFYETMAYGSPPVAIRAGMMSIALVPWITALASKANMISFMTGIGHERLIVLHRWGAYICMILAIIHAVPYWYQSMQDPEGFEKFKLYFHQDYYIFTTGIACLCPLVFLIVHSLPILRNKFYELFVFMHIPVAWGFIALLFWHCHNYLTSWAYLYTTVILMIVSLIARLFYLNWMNPLRPSWLIGEESAVTILPENAVKVTIPTQMKWKPGQWAYLRMPGISVVQNHPFTIASLCSEDFPSDYGDKYRDMTMVFRPFSGFTRRVYDAAQKKGPAKTYRSFIEGPYGGMQRQMSSFDQVVFFAGGSGITAIASQLVDLVKRMRDGKATTRSVHVIWAMKRPEIMEWFKEELRICREYAPPGSVHCHFFITSAKRYDALYSGSAAQANRFSKLIAEKVDGVLQGVGNKRDSRLAHDFDMGGEEEDLVTALPQKQQFASPISRQPYFPPPPGQSDYSCRSPMDDKRASSSLSEMQVDAVDMLSTERLYNAQRTNAHQSTHFSAANWPPPRTPTESDEKTDANRQSAFDFGFPRTPTQFQKSLMRFAFLPGTLPPTEPAPAHQTAFTGDKRIAPSGTPLSIIPNRSSFYEKSTRRLDGWRTEYGRPDIPFMLKNLSAEFSRRTCIYVCGPPEMRTDVARTVADLQRLVWTNSNRDEIFLHAENYAI